MGNFTHLKFLTIGLLNAWTRYIPHVHTTVQGIVTEKDRGDPREDANNIIINLDNNISINEMYVSYCFNNELNQI